MRSPIGAGGARADRDNSCSTGVESRPHLAVAAVGSVVARRPALAVFIVALALRVSLSLLIASSGQGFFASDDATYHDLASQHASGATDKWDAYSHFLFDATAAFLLPLAFLYELFGPSKPAGQLYVAVLGATTAAVVVHVAREAVPLVPAVLAGLLVAVLPSQVLFSSLILKDAAVWLVLALLAWVVAVAARSVGLRLARCGIAGTVLLLVLGHLRLHTLVVACWALAMSAPFGRREQRAARVGGAAIVALAVPLVLGMGPAGISFVRHGTSTLEQRRLGNAQNAATAFVKPDRAPSAPVEPGGGSIVGPQVPPEDVTTAVSDPAPEASATHSLRALPRGLSVMVLEPYPWTTPTNNKVLLAAREGLLWWPLLSLAALGVASWPRYRRTLSFPLLCAGGILIMYSASEGNFGTAYRHRGELVWAVALFAGVGVARVIEYRARRDPSS